jgi:hypothetical protein
MTRKLLPYEYELIETLGITREEYFDFLDQQHVYKDSKVGTQLDIRNAEPATWAIILTIVGILFQVASALLMRPSAPGAAEGSEQTRDQRVGRRFGFNGAQELAKYGEPIPLVYTNTSDNPRGGVRVSTLLLWSAILSFGNHQFMRLMMTIGAAKILSIDPERTAIGQFPVRDLVLSNIWQYFNPNGPTRYDNLQQIDNLDAKDPTKDGGGYTAQISQGDDLTSQEGFSQAFAPTTAESVGVTGFIPINVDLLTLNKAGNPQRKLVPIRLAGAGQYWTNSDSGRNSVPVGTNFTLTIPKVEEDVLSDDTRALARQDAVRAAAALIDNGSLFKSGSLLLRVVSADYGRNGNIETSNLTVKLKCVRRGKFPLVPYNRLHWLDVKSAEREDQETKLANNKEEIEQKTAAIAENTVYLNRGFVRFPTRDASIQYLTADEIKALKKENTAFAAEIKKLEGLNVKIRRTLEGIYASALQPFFTKGLARVEEAAYASVTKCHVLDMALRFQVYRRLSGRSSVYGSEQVDYGHSASNNGAKARTAMFMVWYRLNNETAENKLPYIFCCRGFNEQDVFAYLKLQTTGGPKAFSVRLEAVVSHLAEQSTGGIKGYCYLDSTAKAILLDEGDTGDKRLTVLFNGSRKTPDNDIPYNKSPRDTTEFDLFNYDAFSTSSFSFDNGPEISITAVNEQLIDKWKNYAKNKSGESILYNRLSNFALHVVSGSGTQDLRNVSVWVDKGKALRRLSPNPIAYNTDAEITALANSTPDQASSYAPDIFLDTILDKDDGIGEYADLHSVDVQQLSLTKRFCIKNKLFMDGVIADQRSWREFWAQVAPYSLLELAKIGGRETLIPALPFVRATGAISRDIEITVLFNQGNILEGTLKEEFMDYGASTQDVIITVIFRNVENNGIFPRNDSVEIKLTDTIDGNAIRQTIDASQFVTRREQAILLGKFLCNTRRHSRRAIEFQTFPTDAPISPGDYIYVETGNTQWDQIYTGRIEAGGVLNLPIATRVPNGSYNFLSYTINAGSTKEFNNVTVTNNTAPALAPRAGDLFVLGRPLLDKRVFRITEISMEEEGETTVRAVEHPCGTGSKSLIARGLDVTVNGLFTIDGDLE